MTTQNISPGAQAARMTEGILHRAVALIDLYRRRAGVLDRTADVVTARIRRRRKGGNGAPPAEWYEDRDGLREEAQFLRMDAREMERVLGLVLRGRFIAAKQKLNGELCDPCGCVLKILGPTVDRGLRNSNGMCG